MEVLDPVSYQDGSRLVYRGKVDHGVLLMEVLDPVSYQDGSRLLFTGAKLTMVCY